MKKIFSITSVLILTIVIVTLVAPLAVSAIPAAAEQCCKVGAELKWEGFLNGTVDCSGTTDGHCRILKGETVGPKVDTKCSLPDADGVKPVTPVAVDNYSPDWGIICVLGTIAKVTNWIFFLLMTGAVLVIVYGGFLYITAAGDPSKAEKGKIALTLAIIGIALALIARLVPSAVRFIMGM